MPSASSILSHRMFFFSCPACCYLLLLLPFCRLAASSMLIACLLASTVLLSSFLHGVQPSPACPADSELQHLIPSGASQAQVTRPVTSISWSRGVTVSTLDSESSDRGSNPRGTSCPPRLLSFPTACFFFISCPLLYLLLLLPFCRLAASSMLITCLLASTVLLSSFLHGVQPSPALELDLANVT